MSKRDVFGLLKESRTGRAVIFFGFAALVSFLVFVYGLLKEQDYARQEHRLRTGALFALKASYQDYESTLLLHLADPARVLVSDAQKRFSNLEERLARAEESITNPEERKTLKYVRNSLARISPVTFDMSSARMGVEGDLREVLIAMTGIQSSMLGLEASLSEKSEGFAATQSMQTAAELLLVISALVLLLLVVRLMTRQTDIMKLLRLEKDTADRQVSTHLAAIEASRDGIVILDQQGRIIFMNRAFALLHYLSALGRKESIGRFWGDLYNAQGGAIVSGEILPAARNKGFWHGESTLVNERGKPFVADLSLTTLPEGGFIGTAQDTRERAAKDKETEELRLQYYQAQKMESIGRLAGGIAHDFNNIIAAVTGYAEFLVQDLPAGSATKGFAEKILLANQRAKELIEQILNFSRANDQGKLDLDLALAIDEVVSLLRASMSSGIDIRTDLKAETARILGNSTQISQALMNLCVNAQDAMDGKGTLDVSLDVVDPVQLDWTRTLLVEHYPEGNAPPAVHIHSIDDSHTVMAVGHIVQGQKYARISVTDSGTGISRAVMERMFEPFFTTKDVHKGTGLGLASVHGILISHRGFLSVDTTEGKGSSFQLFFPLNDSGADMAGEGVAEDDGEGTGHGRILVVDDQDDVRTTMCIMLQRGGYEVFDSQSPAEALALIADNPQHFDAVLTDYSMPVMTGVELAAAASRAAPGLPFILISGYAEADTKEKIAAVPAIRDFIKKPVSSDILLRKVRALLAS